MRLKMLLGVLVPTNDFEVSKFLGRSSSDRIGSGFSPRKVFFFSHLSGLKSL
jgi:hypothetical protein